MATLTTKKKPQKKSITGAKTREMAEMIPIAAIKTADPFETLFPIDTQIADAITEDMRKNGYDQSQPIHVWKERDVVLDGHTRLMAAQRADFYQVPVYKHSFESEQEAVEYAIHNQRDRRNLTDSELYSYIQALDRIGQAGRRKELAPLGANLDGPKSKSGAIETGKSAKRTAAAVGTSARKVERARTIQKHANEEMKAALRSGAMSINKAYRETVEKRRPKRTVSRAGESVALDDTRLFEFNPTLPENIKKEITTVLQNHYGGKR